MRLSVEEDLRRAFELAAMRREAMVFHKPEQWRAVSKLQQRCETARRKEQLLYQHRYQTRVEQRRRQLIDEAAAKPMALKPWWAQIDRFSAQESLLQAQRDVRRAHEQRLQRIDSYEGNQLAALVKSARIERSPNIILVREFDREAGPQNRGPQR